MIAYSAGARRNPVSRYTRVVHDDLAFVCSCPVLSDMLRKHL